jgi:hypothetical protein
LQVELSTRAVAMLSEIESTGFVVTLARDASNLEVKR